MVSRRSDTPDFACLLLSVDCPAFSLPSATVFLTQVNEAEEERLRSEREHMRVTHACQEAEARVQMLQKSLKRAIVKSKPYFELKAQFNHILEVIQTQQ